MGYTDTYGPATIHSIEGMSERIQREGTDELNSIMTKNGQLLGCKAGRLYPDVDASVAIHAYLEILEANEFETLRMLPKIFFKAALDGVEMIRYEEAYIRGEA
jgi:hypothetical protein